MLTSQRACTSGTHAMQQQPLLSRQCFREDQPNRVVVPHLFCLLKLSYDS